jgi:hypothetical protein
MRSTDLGVVPESGNCSKISVRFDESAVFLVATRVPSMLVDHSFGLVVDCFGVCTCLSDMQIMVWEKGKEMDGKRPLVAVYANISSLLP